MSRTTIALAAIAALMVAAAPAEAAKQVKRSGEAAKVLGGGGPIAQETYSCGGGAPLTTSCSTEFDEPMATRYRLNVAGGPPFDGIVTARLTDSTGRSATYHCNFSLYLAPPYFGNYSCGGSGPVLQAGHMRLEGWATPLRAYAGRGVRSGRIGGRAGR